MPEQIRTNRRENQAKGAAVGAGAGALAMPVRVRNNAKQAGAFKDLPEGPHTVNMEDVHRIARTTGRRTQNTAYTADRAKKVREGTMEPGRLKLLVTGEGHVHQVDGAHGTWANTMNGHKTMGADIIRRPNDKRTTKRGLSMIDGEIRSAYQRHRLRSDAKKMTPEKVDARAAKIHPHTVARNKIIGEMRESSAKWSGQAKFDPASKVGPATSKLRGKQGAYLLGGAAVGAGAMALGQRGADKIQVKVKKSDSTSAFGVDHGSLR